MGNVCFSAHGPSSAPREPACRRADSGSRSCPVWAGIWRWCPWSDARSHGGPSEDRWALGCRGVDVGEKNGEELFLGVIQEAKRHRIKNTAHLPGGVDHLVKQYFIGLGAGLVAILMLVAVFPPHHRREGDVRIAAAALADDGLAMAVEQHVPIPATAFGQPLSRCMQRVLGRGECVELCLFIGNDLHEVVRAFFKLVKHRLACAAVVHAAELVQHGVLVLRGRGVRLRSRPIYGHMMVLEMLGLVVRMQMCVWWRA